MLSASDNYRSLELKLSRSPEYILEIPDELLRCKTNEPIFVGILLQLIEWSASHDESIQKRSKASLLKLFTGMNHISAMVCIEEIILITVATKRWQVKIQCLECIQVLVKVIGKQSSEYLPELVPVLTDLMWSTKLSIKKAASKTIKRACKKLDNRDLSPFIPELINAISHPRRGSRMCS